MFVVIAVEDRPGFLHYYFEDLMFDLSVFGAANKFLKAYAGGYWDYVMAGNGAPFLRLQGLGPQTIIPPTGDSEFLVDRNLAGMVVTYCALRGLGELTYRRGISIELLKGGIADYCIEKNYIGILESLTQ